MIDMVDKDIHIRSTSWHSADADPVVLRENSAGRLVFMPSLVDRPGSLDTSVRGTLLYQKKKASGVWRNNEPIPLSSLRDGEGVKLELKSAETRTLFQKLGEFYSIAENYGVPKGDNRFVRAPESDLLRQLLEGGELDRMLGQSEGADLLKKFLVWLTRNGSSLTASLEGLKPGELINFDAAVGAARLKLFLAEYEANQDNQDEAYWQDLFERRRFPPPAPSRRCQLTTRRRPGRRTGSPRSAQRASSRLCWLPGSSPSGETATW